MNPTELPLISTRKNGDRLVGHSDDRAGALHAAGTPPMHGLAARPGPTAKVSAVRVGDTLVVQRVGERWEVRDRADDLIGLMRWTPGQDGRRHSTTGKVIHLPDRGKLHVLRLLLSPGGVVKDIGGTIFPEA